MKEKIKDPAAALAKTYKNELREIEKSVSKLDLNPDAEQDYERIRATLNNLLDKANQALDSLLCLSEESEHPRAFEVLAGLIKTIADVADQLFKMQKTRHELVDLNHPERKKEQQQTTNNYMFVGSTSDLQRMILDQRKIIDVG